MQRLVRVFEDFVYGFDSGVDVPMEAAHALVRGLDSPALVDLAGLYREERLEIRDLIPAAAEQLEFAIEPLNAVFERRVREIAAAYLAGEREFADALSGILASFWRYQDEGIGCYCCDALLDLQLWFDVREYDDTFGSAEAAERDFRARAVAMVGGCLSCKSACRIGKSARLRAAGGSGSVDGSACFSDQAFDAGEADAILPRKRLLEYACLVLVHNGGAVGAGEAAVKGPTAAAGRRAFPDSTSRLWHSYLGDRGQVSRLPSLPLVLSATVPAVALAYDLTRSAPSVWRNMPSVPVRRSLAGSLAALVVSAGATACGLAEEAESRPGPSAELQAAIEALEDRSYSIESSFTVNGISYIETSMIVDGVSSMTVQHMDHCAIPAVSGKDCSEDPVLSRVTVDMRTDTTSQVIVADDTAYANFSGAFSGSLIEEFGDEAWFTVDAPSESDLRELYEDFATFDSTALNGQIIADLTEVEQVGDIEFIGRLASHTEAIRTLLRVPTGSTVSDVSRFESVEVSVELEDDGDLKAIEIVLPEAIGMTTTFVSEVGDFGGEVELRAPESDNLHPYDALAG